MRQKVLEDFQKKTIIALRKNFPEMKEYLDEEIANAYSFYCETFYCAGWTEVDDLAKFVKWATTIPMKQFQ